VTITLGPEPSRETEYQRTLYIPIETASRSGWTYSLSQTNGPGIGLACAFAAQRRGSLTWEALYRSSS
jgi:hypothetical protein